MSEQGPPDGVWLDLEEALTLLATLEDARRTFLGSDHLAGYLDVQAGIETLVRKLGFDEGGTDDR